MGDPTNELRARLDELDVRWWPDVYYRDTNTCWRVGDFEWRASEQKEGRLLIGCTCVKYLTPEQAIAATVGKDIEHYDGSGRRGTVAILQGGRKPEEVMFVGEGGGVTHYLPENAETCERVYHQNRITKKCTCSNCGYGASDERWAYCPKCGHKYVHGEVEERWKRAGRKVAE